MLSGNGIVEFIMFNGNELAKLIRVIILVRDREELTFENLKCGF